MPHDPVVQEKIAAVVTEFVEQGRMFTAFEVSLKVKEQGVRERHRNLKESVHATIFTIGAPNGYTRTLMDVGAPEQAWVYHTMRDNPYTYVPLDRGGHGAQPAVRRGPVPRGIRNPRPLRANDPSPALIPDGVFGTDSDGRLVVPATMLSHLGVKAGGPVNVRYDAANTQLLLTRPSALDSTPPDATAVVESDGQLRLDQGMLDKASLGGLQTYYVEGKGNVITVREFV